MQNTNIIPEDDQDDINYDISEKENKDSEIFSQINTCQSNNIMNTSTNIQNKNEIKVIENNNNKSISYKDNQSFQFSENNDNYIEDNLKNNKTPKKEIKKMF